MGKTMSFIVGICFSFNLGCQTKESSKMENKIRYYESFSGYELPLILSGEISKNDVASREASYYVGYYNSNSKLHIVEKYYKKVLFFKHEYIFFSSGKIKKATITNADGLIKTLSFD